MATTPFSVCKEFCAGGGGTSNAKDVEYDNTNSGLVADDVGGAIDELSNKIVDTNARLMKKESILNKVTVIDDDANNTSYPTTKAVKDYVDENKVEVNVLQGTAIGHPLVLTDVSPIPHEITVFEDVGGVGITRRGKNLLPVTRTLSFPADANYSVDCYIPSPFTLSLRIVIDTVSTPKSIFIKLVYTDGTEETITPNYWGITTAGTYQKTKTIDNGKILKQVVFLNWSGITGNVYDAQIEFGKTATTFEPYVEPVLYYSDGDAIKIPALYPTTVLSVDGAEGLRMTAEYNRDINKVIANLENALLSLGGNV